MINHIEYDDFIHYKISTYPYIFVRCNRFDKLFWYMRPLFSTFIPLVDDLTNILFPRRDFMYYFDIEIVPYILIYWIYPIFFVHAYWL